MKKIVALILILFFAPVTSANAYWIWTPQTGRWINPRTEVKGSPEEQLKFALELFTAKEYKKSEQEFIKLIHRYRRAKEAAEAQYYIGRIMEDTNRPFQAFLAYQRVIDKYPFSERQAEIVERQYNLGERLMKAKITFWDSVAGKEYNVIEIFRKAVENAPFGKYAAISQYKIGLVLKNAGMYSEARQEFEKVVNEYPQSEWVKASRYQIALCDAKAAPKPAYDQSTTKDAVKEFEEFVKTYPGAELTDEAKSHIRDLKDKEAENNFKIAQFYEKQKAFAAAKIYYNTVVEDYQGTQWAVKSLEHLRILEKKGK
ncbi:MAG: outer membrane protein assembly factor BamD [Candidatus Omnitrophota bacterium]